MSETKSNETVCVGKELLSYVDNHNNYIAPCEITVTITLNEYRELVATAAKQDKVIEELKESYESRIQRLNTESSYYKEQLEQLKAKIGEE